MVDAGDICQGFPVRFWKNRCEGVPEGCKQHQHDVERERDPPDEWKVLIMIVLPYDLFDWSVIRMLHETGHITWKW